MLEWLSANYASVIAAAIIVIILVLAVRGKIKSHKNGGCGCGCPGCMRNSSNCTSSCSVYTSKNNRIREREENK